MNDYLVFLLQNTVENEGKGKGGGEGLGGCTLQRLTHQNPTKRQK